MTPFTAGCQAAISWKFSSITQSNSSSGRALFASLSAGSAWIRSPSEVSLMSRILFIFPRKDPFQEGAEAVPLQVTCPRFFGSHVVELKSAPLAFERLVSVPAVRGDLEDQAAPRIRGDFRGVGAQIAVVVEKPEPSLGRAPGRVEVEKNGDQLGFRIGVDTAVLFSRAAALLDPCLGARRPGPSARRCASPRPGLQSDPSTPRLPAESCPACRCAES